MAMYRRQWDEYGSMSFENLCDMIDELKEENDKIEDLRRELDNQLEETIKNLELLQSAYDDLSFNGR